MRKRIWEIAEMFYCPIAGICLTIPEQKQLLKRCGVKVKGSQNYAIHGMLIEEAKKESIIAKRLENMLNHKYRREIAEWQTFSPEEWLPFFNNTLTPVTAGALLWFSVIYLDIPARKQVDIYGRIHMLLHEQFLQQSALLKQLERVEKKHKTLQEKYRTLQTQLRHKRNMLRELERCHTLRQQECDALRTENLKLKQTEQVAGLQAECEALRQKLYRTEEKLQTRTVAVEELRTKESQLKRQLAEHRMFVKEMQDEFTRILEHFKQAASPVGHCPNYALCNRRILIVGGITKLRAFYEQLVTKMGGQFEYHDGDKCDGSDALSHLVSRSDVVLCPVDVNSHSACLSVKKFCKKLNKPYYMLHSSSISTIHKTLTEVAAMSN